MKNFRKDSGITLIALVVTIVVLLILAGITISTLFGDNGIITAARKAADDTAKDQTNTEQGIKNLEDQMADAMDASGLMNLVKANSFITAAQGNQIISDRTGKTMIVPVGFKIASDSATEIDKGVVIEDKECNQYVWVPVSTDAEFNDMFGSSGSGNNINYYGKLYDLQNSTNGKGSPINSTVGSSSGNREPDIVTSYDGTHEKYTAAIGNITADDFKSDLQINFNEMAKSVKQYKGFYIGRYEVSNLTNSNPTTTIPKVKKGVNPSNSINWYNMYREIQNIETYTNSGIQSDVKTNMIWGCQWDRTIDWIANTDTKIGYAGLKDSRYWGNYEDSETFTFTKADGTTGTKTKNSGTLTPTGSTKRNKANNIYDLAGNLYEWTMEAGIGGGRTSRGGGCYRSGSGYPVSYRSYGYDFPNYNYSYIGSRPTLYVLSTI